MKGAFLVPVLVTLAACNSGSSGVVAADRRVLVDDSQQGQLLNHFSYSGQWEHVRSRNDGRDDGTSSRSRHAGDSAIFTFDGSVVRIYGVEGPNGGDAAVGIDGHYYGTASFYSRKKQTHALVFESPPMPAGPHMIGFVVKGDVLSAHRAYVNIDSAEVLP